MHKQTLNITISAIALALVFVATFIIKIPNGMQGYFNLGDAIILIFATVLSPFSAFVFAGFGSGLADLVGGYGIYFFFTLIIKGLEGAFIAYCFKKSQTKSKHQIIFMFALLIMLFGYFIADTIINQSMYLAFIALGINLIQAILCWLIASLLLPWINKYKQLI